MRRALILGINGQDGSYLADYLLSKSYIVHGLYRRNSGGGLYRLRHLEGSVVLHPGDVLDPGSVLDTLFQCMPDEIYHLADQDNVSYSRSTPAYSLDITAKSVLDLLSLVYKIAPAVKVFVPVSATIFGRAPPPQSETTPISPQSPYSIAKAAALHYCHLYRSMGLFVSTAIYCNHDSPRRAPGYLLQRICRGAANVSNGRADKLQLWGDLDCHVDIGYAKEYVTAAHSMLQLPRPSDYVISSRKSYRIRDLALHALHLTGVPEGALEVLPSDTPQPVLIGDSTRATEAFQWSPATNAMDLVELLVSEALDGNLM